MSFAVTIFISAFLLFQVQPIIARYILPWFGGSPAVWSACMLFFQVGLLLGYGYAHAIRHFLDTRRQIIVHAVLLVLSLSLLPVTPDASMKPDSVDSPVLDILVLLMSTVGLPYVVVSSTGPLLQHWFATRYPGRSPYRLYALSNVGSLLALLSYPFLVEPALGLNEQTLTWSIGYVVFVLCCGWAGWTVSRGPDAAAAPVAAAAGDEAPMQPLDPVLWVLLAFCGSVLLLAATHFLSQNIAVIPFLWVMPLSLYLITFILAFDNPRWTMRWFWIPAMLLFVLLIFGLLDEHYIYNEGDLVEQLFIFSAGLFVTLMVVHGEMVRLKPPARQLTLFYLMIAFGGALGGAFVTFAAPALFSDYWEWPYGLVLALLLTAVCLIRRPGFDLPKMLRVPNPTPKLRRGSRAAVLIALLGGAGVFSYQTIGMQQNFSHDVLDSERNFFGVLRVIESSKGRKNHRNKLYHGTINHGIQYRDPARRHVPTTYYSLNSGIGLAINNHPRRLAGEGLNVGVIGLGTGTLGVYLLRDDRFTFYEIDPDVERLAREYFTYLNDDGDRIEVVLGDARIQLERELETGGSRQYDIIAVDAFSGDAIPIHLLTTEAIDLYREHLKGDGILALHISNRYIDLKQLVHNLARDQGLQSRIVLTPKDAAAGIKSTVWMLLTNNEEFLANQQVNVYSGEWEPYEQRDILWTDDYSNLFGVLKDDLFDDD